MTVDRFGSRGTDDRSGISSYVINKSFVRRDGATL